MKAPLFFGLILLILSSTACKQSEVASFSKCFKKDKGKLIGDLERDFELQLKTNYSQKDFRENVLLYLHDLSVSEQTSIIKPSPKLANRQETKSLVQDIWENKEVRFTSKFKTCLGKSDRQITKEYLDRLNFVGDISIGAVLQGAIEMIESERSIDSELKLILIINFYLIWIN